MFADATGNGSLAGFKGIAAQESIRIEDGEVRRHDDDFTMSTNDATEPGVVTVLEDGYVEGDIRVGPDGDPATDIFVDEDGEVDGVVGTLAKPVEFPEMTLPNLGASAGPLVLTSDTTVSENLHLDSLTVADGVKLKISGKQTFVIDGGLTLVGNAKIEMASSTSMLDVYMSGPLTLGDGAEIHPDKARKVSIFYLGTDDIFINHGRKVTAGLYAPNARLEISGGQMKGNALVKGLTVSNGGWFEVKSVFGVRSFPMVTSCGDTLTDEAGEPGTPGAGAITSGPTFSQWFSHDLAVNTSMVHPILLTNNGSGVWEFLSDAFYPADDQLFGNEGQSHNNFFTYSMEATFTCETCTGQFFEFEGVDDAWVYVDNQLVIDLGGMLQAQSQRVDIDRLGLDDGTEHTLRLFFAQRQPYMSRFNVRTNLLLQQPNQIVSVSGSYD
jgi:fibro-slime domain-containing protein